MLLLQDLAELEGVFPPPVHRGLYRLAVEFKERAMEVLLLARVKFADHVPQFEEGLELLLLHAQRDVVSWHEAEDLLALVEVRCLEFGLCDLVLQRIDLLAMRLLCFVVVESFGALDLGLEVHEEILELILLEGEPLHHADLVLLECHLALERGAVHLLGKLHRRPGEVNVLLWHSVPELVERVKPAVNVVDLIHDAKHVRLTFGDELLERR
mmetsp:Transcript_24874/g.57545  ORF Transcript_24874/g.57545 Transcript_24874/m.57545 type:complete len:212 (-) Transcript_24874:2403-3038(-)